MTGLLSHAAATGFVVALASSDRFAAHTTWLLQKDDEGCISPISRLLFWPYHLGLRGKLFVQVGLLLTARENRAQLAMHAVAVQARLRQQWLCVHAH